MRLATITVEGGSAAAVIDGDHAAGVVCEESGATFADVGALLRAGERGWARALDTIEHGRFEPLEPEHVLRPILQPGAVVCVGLNYRPHILEMGRKLPDHPTYFSKLPRALTDHARDVELPRESTRVDYEGELVAIVGVGGRDIPIDSAWAAIAGLTLMNDVSMRDFQYRTLQWFAGKSWQECTPVGPVLVTPDELEPLAERELRVEVNGQLRQQAIFGDLVFDIPALVVDLSRIIELQPGDLIATGTPGGVGDAMDPQQYLADGDVVEVTVDGLGSLRNTFRRHA